MIACPMCFEFNVFAPLARTRRFQEYHINFRLGFFHRFFDRCDYFDERATRQIVFKSRRARTKTLFDAKNIVKIPRSPMTFGCTSMPR